MLFILIGIIAYWNFQIHDLFFSGPYSQWMGAYMFNSLQAG